MFHEFPMQIHENPSQNPKKFKPATDYVSRYARIFYEAIFVSKFEPCQKEQLEQSWALVI